MSIELYSRLLRKWKQIDAAIEKGKVHEANQKRFASMDSLSKKMDSLGLTPEQKQRAWNNLSKQKETK